MNILIVHNSYQYPGGEETYTRSLASLLKKRGHNVFVYTRNNKEIKTVWDKISAAFSILWSRQTTKDIHSIVKRFKPDIAQAHNVFPLISPSVYWALRKEKVPIVQLLASYRYVCPKSTLFRNGSICEQCVNKRFFYPSIVNRCYQDSAIGSFFFSLSFFLHLHIFKTFGLIDSFLFPSQFTKNYITDHVPETRHNAIHLPHLTLPALYQQRVKKREGFVYVGRLSEEKGVLTLLSLFARDDCKEFSLTIVGDGPLKDVVSKSCHHHKNIRYIGSKNRERIAELMGRSQALILPDLWFDVQPIVVLEALSQGLPVIAPSTPVFREIVLHKKTGFLYKSESELISYVNDISHRPLSIVKKDKDMILEKHSPPYHYARIISLYKSIIKNKKKQV